MNTEQVSTKVNRQYLFVDIISNDLAYDAQTRVRMRTTTQLWIDVCNWNWGSTDLNVILNDLQNQIRSKI